AAIALSVGLAYSLASWERTGTIVLLVAGLAGVLVLALCLPPHLFVASSLAVLVTFQLSAEHPFVLGGIHPLTVGGIVLYSSDLLVALVLVRALAPRPRRSVDWNILDVHTAVAVLLWGLVMIAAAARGYQAGTAPESVARLGEQLFYYPILAWGLIRVLRER